MIKNHNSFTFNPLIKTEDIMPCLPYRGRQINILKDGEIIDKAIISNVDAIRDRIEVESLLQPGKKIYFAAMTNGWKEISSDGQSDNENLFTIETISS